MDGTRDEKVEYLLGLRAAPYVLRVIDAPCSLPHDWRYKNSIGITTSDVAHARAWAFEIMQAGYGVGRCFGGGAVVAPW
jgi:hypothetical protein